MARDQLWRPSPVAIFSRFRRRDGTVITIPLAEEHKEDQQGLDSPDEPLSSPSTVDGQSDSEHRDSDSDDEEPSSTKSAASSSASKPVPTLGSDSTSAPLRPTSSFSNSTSSTPLPTFQTTSKAATAALPLLTSTTLATTRRPTITSTPTTKSQSDRQKQTSPTASVSQPRPPPPPVSTPEAELSGGASETLPKPEAPIMTRQAMVATIILGILGALALLIAAVIFIKRRKGRDHYNHAPLSDEQFNASMAQALQAPETTHTGTASSIFARLQGASNGGGERPLTRSTARSNTLFGPGSYSRPETVSTDRNDSSMPPPTPNPFEDPQRNKAYDMLNNRPRSTTLTDRGSWRENPFKNPESDRFDPFGELKEKARRERLRYLEQAKREAELQRQMQQKEAMGLRPDDMPWGHDNGYR